MDTDSQLITAVEVLPGNAPDNLGSLELVEQSEANTGVPVEEAMVGRRLWGYRYQADLRRCGTPVGGQSAGKARPEALSQG